MAVIMNFEVESQNVKTVSELNKEIQALLDCEYRFVRVLGEISNLRRPLSGHYYFNLKDQSSQIRAVLFKNQQRYLARSLEDGQQVVLHGRVSVYEPRGEYQIIVDTADFQGHGLLQVAFEQLKLKLRREGLFESERKKRLPELVKNILLITSPTGAAVHDFLAICRKRQMAVNIQLLPVVVQGENSAGMLIDALRKSRALAPDVIVLCRGGGSIEDLWSFNDETLARAIADSDIPVVTGIGHETDFTIADFCADVRAATPTAAAELLIPDQLQFRRKLVDLSGRIGRAMHWQIETVSQRLKRSTAILAALERAFGPAENALRTAYSRLLSSITRRLDHSTLELAALEVNLMQSTPQYRIEIEQSRVTQLTRTLCYSMHRQIDSKRNLLGRNAAVLDSLSPLATLARGYALVMKKKAGIGAPLVRTVTQLQAGDDIVIKLHDGTADCAVTNIGTAEQPDASGGS
jgi:exodeoxyribonuclease VII large subunit